MASLFARPCCGIRLPLALLANLVLFLVSATQLNAQPNKSNTLPIETKIQQQLAELNASQKAHASDRELGIQWAQLAWAYETAADFTQAESSYTHALHLLGADPSLKPLYAEVLDNLGSLYLIYGHTGEALNCRRKALALRQQLGDPLQMARGQSHLAEVDLTARKYKQALSEAEQAYRLMERLDDPQKGDLASVLIVLAYTHCDLRDCEQGVAEARQALEISRSALASEPKATGAALLALGFAQSKSGAAADGLESTQQGISIFRGYFASGDPRLTHALLQYRSCLLAQHRKSEARAVDDQITAVASQSKQSCASCSVSVYGLRPFTP